MTGDDAMRRLAAANPIPTPPPDHAADAAALLAAVASTASAPSGRVRHRRLLVGVAAAALVAVPTAVSAWLTGIYGLTNGGVGITTGEIAAPDLSSFGAAGAIGEIRRLAVRDGRAFYAVRRQDGGLCFAIGEPNSPPPRRLGFAGCQTASPTSFPSPEHPLLDFSAISYDAQTRTITLRYLAGFAADGVATIAVIGQHKKTIAAVPVVNNVYSASDMPDQPITALIARASDGTPLGRVRIDPRGP